jgi:hypothetical protein
MTPKLTPEEKPDQTAWLIEETWSGFVHYVHKDFDARAWQEECRANDLRWEQRLPRTEPRTPFITKIADEAMRFDTPEAAVAWIRDQPRFISHGDQFQAREHMWCTPEEKPAQLTERRDIISRAADLIHALYHALDNTGQHMGSPECKCHEPEAYVMDKDDGDKLNEAFLAFTGGDEDAHEMIAELRKASQSLRVEREKALREAANVAITVANRYGEKHLIGREVRKAVLALLHTQEPGEERGQG